MVKKHMSPNMKLMVKENLNTHLRNVPLLVYVFMCVKLCGWT